MDKVQVVPIDLSIHFDQSFATLHRDVNLLTRDVGVDAKDSPEFLIGFYQK